MKIVTNKFLLSQELYMKISRDINAKRFKYYNIAISIIWVSIVIFCMWGYFHLHNWEILKAWTPVLLILPVWPIWLIWLIPFFLAKSKLNRFDYDNAFFEIDDEGFSYVRDDGSISRRPFKSMVKIIIGKDYFIFFENATSVFMLPFSAFKSDDDIAILNELLMNYGANQ